MKSPTVFSASQLTVPRTVSSMVTFAPGCTLNRTVCGSPLASFSATTSGSASRHAPSYITASPASSAAARFASSSSSVQKQG